MRIRRLRAEERSFPHSPDSPGLTRRERFRTACKRVLRASLPRQKNTVAALATTVGVYVETELRAE